jgi:hypothetical protein
LEAETPQKYLRISNERGRPMRVGHSTMLVALDIIVLGGTVFQMQDEEPTNCRQKGDVSTLI